MKDYLEQAQRLRQQAAECAEIRDQAKDSDKREMFDRLVSHFTVLAGQLELAIIERQRGGTRQ